MAPSTNRQCSHCLLTADSSHHPARIEAKCSHPQALCFLAGADSIFYGEKLLTAADPEEERDRQAITPAPAVELRCKRSHITTPRSPACSGS